MPDQLALPETEKFTRPMKSPEQMVEWAIEKGANAEQIGKLWDVFMQWHAHQAKMAYIEAMATFKANPPDIRRTKLVTIATKGGDQIQYRHAELQIASELVGQALKGVGIRHSWKCGEGENGRIKVTCVLTHDLGHSEEISTLYGPPDASGSKNSVQAIGSTTTYLQRYTLLAGTGLVPEGLDDDGKTEGMDENAILDYCVQIQDASSLEEAKAAFGPAWTRSKDMNDKQAMDRIRKAYEEKKKALWAQKN